MSAMLGSVEFRDRKKCEDFGERDGDLKSGGQKEAEDRRELDVEGDCWCGCISFIWYGEWGVLINFMGVGMGSFGFFDFMI